MKIAVLSFTSGRIDRGVETAVRELVKRWRKKHQVKVISVNSVDWQSFTKVRPWLKILMVDKYHRLMFKETVKAWQQLRKWQPEVVMPMNGGWQSLLSRLFCWQTGAKLVISGQAGLGWCDGWNLLMRPDVFVALSERNRRWAKKFYGRGVRIEVIPNGVNLQRFRPEGGKLDLKLKRPIILCVASEDKYKRVEVTKRAVERLDKGSFLWVGGKRKFKHEQMPAVYRAADVFTLVSDSTEGFGNVYLEALASGLPVVATDDELRREILGDYGIYVKDVWGEEYVEKLKLALSKKRYQPEQWLKQFSWDKIAEDYISIFSRWRLK